MGIINKGSKRISPKLYTTIAVCGAYRRNRKWYNKLISEGVIPGHKSNLSKIKNSNTLFILGTGASVTNYSNAQWEKIKNHDSLGFNDWILHDFVPTIYGAETFHKENIRELLAIKKSDYKNTPIIFKSVWRRKKSSVYELPEYVQDNLITFFDITIPGNSKKEMEDNLEFVKKFGVTSSNRSPKYILKKTGSLVYYIMLAVRMGYDQIVLCGVDLNNGAYFFQKNKEYYESKGYPVPDKSSAISDNGVHKTFDSNEKPVPIDDAIEVINKVVLQPQGVDIYIGSKESALFPKYPYYFSE